MVSKQLKSKTNWLGIVLIVLTAAQDQLPILEEYIGAHYSLVMYGFAVACIVLRQFTTKPISEK